MCVGEFLLKTTDNKKYSNDSVLAALRKINGERDQQSSPPIGDDDIFVSIVKMGWGTNKNPIEQVAFYLPIAHTCFFSIEMPEYKTEEEMRRAILICCHYGVGGVLVS